MDETKAKYKLVGTLDTTISGKLIYSYLSDLAGKKEKIQVSVRELNRILAISRKTVSKNLHRLQDSRYIDIKAAYHPDGGRTASIYTIR